MMLDRSVKACKVRFTKDKATDIMATYDQARRITNSQISELVSRISLTNSLSNDARWQTALDVYELAGHELLTESQFVRMLASLTGDTLTTVMRTWTNGIVSHGKPTSEHFSRYHNWAQLCVADMGNNRSASREGILQAWLLAVLAMCLENENVSKNMRSERAHRIGIARIVCDMIRGC